MSLHAAAPTSVTFNKDVAPLVFAECASCHRPGEAAPFSLMSYENVQKRAQLIVEVTKSRYMPPWHAENADVKFAGARHLTDAQIATFQKWLDAGTPQGDPADLPPVPKFTEGWQLGQPDLIVKMPESFEVPADGPDLFRNFAIPLNLTEDKWVSAVEFRPSAPNVVHHSLFFLDPTGKASQTKGFARMSFEGRGARERGANGGSLGGWSLGGAPRKLPGGLAYRVSKGSDLILSTHFHPSGKAEREQSVIGLFFADAPPKKMFTSIQLPPAFGMTAGVDIPPNDKEYVKKDSFVLPVDVDAFGLGAHAHYLGKRMEMTATLPDGKVLQLLRIGNYDFNWQEHYPFEEFLHLPKGTRLDATVVWDNSAENPKNPTSPPKRVRWGRESTDEMGSVSLQVVASEAGDLPKLQQDFRQHMRASFLQLGERLGNRRAPGEESDPDAARSGGTN